MFEPNLFIGRRLGLTLLPNQSDSHEILKEKLFSDINIIYEKQNLIP